MTVKNVTISGVLCTKDNLPLINNKVDVYQLTDLFHATVLTQVQTDANGKYEFTYPMTGIQDSLALLSPNQRKGVPALKKFLLVTEDNPAVTIHSPALQQKKLRSTHRHSRVQYSPSDKLAKRSWGPDWEINAMKAIPDTTTATIQESFRKKPIPDNEQEELAFLFNSIFWDPPKISEDGRGMRFSVFTKGLEQHANNEIPSAIINLKRIKGLFYIDRVSLRFRKEKWRECAPNDPDYRRFIYLANSAAIIKGLSSKLVNWQYVLPSLYAQAFLSTISEHNPLRELLGAHLTESLLIDNHLGLPIQKPLIEVTKCSAIAPAEMVEMLLNQLSSQPFVMPEQPLVQENFAKAFHFYKEKIITSTIATFFDCNRTKFENSRDRPVNKYWAEIYALSQTFAALHPLNGTHSKGWWKPFIESPNTIGKGEFQKLKNWCEEALLLTTFFPYVIKKNMDYLTDLRFATLKPINQGLQEDQKTFDEYGGTTLDQAIQQLCKTKKCIDTEEIPLRDYPGKYPSMDKYLHEHAEELRGFEFNPKDLFVPTSGS